jgi:hypothetical protein
MVYAGAKPSHRIAGCCNFTRCDPGNITIPVAERGAAEFLAETEQLGIRDVLLAPRTRLVEEPLAAHYNPMVFGRVSDACAHVRMVWGRDRQAKLNRIVPIRWKSQHRRRFVEHLIPPTHPLVATPLVLSRPFEDPEVRRKRASQERKGPPATYRTPFLEIVP